MSRWATIGLLSISLMTHAALSPGTGWAQAGEQAETWRHLSMDDVRPVIERFKPVRAKYLQLMYDLEGKEEIDGSSFVQIDVDRAVHSGPWDGTAPLDLDPLQEPGLLIVWQIQNALYNGFDRVLTDSRLSLKQRVMPRGFRGLRIGVMEGDEHILIDAVPPDSGQTVRVDRTTLPEGAVNVLTLPYVLAGMNLREGDRFTLPGFALIGGPDGGGIAWRGAAWVRSVGERAIGGEPMRVAEVFFRRLEDGAEAASAFAPGARFTRIMISESAPYLLGRATMIVDEDGEYRFQREFLGLVEWAVLPLATSDNARADLWDLNIETADMRLKPDQHPQVLVPLKPME